MRDTYTIDQVIKAVNSVLPEGAKKLTKSLLQSARSDGVGPKGNLQGQAVVWNLYDALSAYHFVIMRANGITRQKCKDHLVAISLKVKLNSIGNFAWLDIYKDKNGNQKSQFVDEPGKDIRTLKPDAPVILLFSINIVESIRVMREALSKA